MKQSPFPERLLFFCLLPGFLCLSGLSANAQIERWRTLGLEDGLPQVQVYDMAQDPGGWIWIGTHGGVSRFDGGNFRNYTQRDGLEDNHTSAILPLGPNEVFLAHAYSSAFTYLKNDSIYPVKGIPEGYSGRGNDLIRKEERILAASTEGLLVLEQEGNSIQCVAQLDTNNGMESMHVHRLFDPGTDEIWAVQHEHVLRIDPFAEEEGMIIDTLPLRDAHPPVQFHMNEDGDLYVLTHDSVLRYPAPSAYPGSAPLESHSLPEQLDPTAFVIKDEELWIGTNDHGVHRILPERRVQYGQKEGIPNEQVTKLLCSQAGNVWIGTDHGIAHSTDLAFQFINERNGLENPVVWAIEPGAENDLWVGTEGGLTQLRFHGPKFLQLKEAVQFGEEKGLEMIDALHLDKHGRLWVSNRHKGSELLILDAKDGELLHRWPLHEAENYLAIESRENGNILIGGGPSTLYEAKVDSSTGKISAPEPFQSAGEKAVPTDLWDIYRDPSGKTWIGSNGKGAGFLKDGEYHSLGGEEATPHPRIISITQDENDDIWFGTIGDGVIRYDGEDFDSVTIDDGLTVNTPFFVQADGQGNIWAGSSNGVDRIRIRDHEVTTFGREKGLVGMETNQNARACMENGGLWFGTIKGLIRCMPDRIRSDSIPPRLHMQSLKVASEPHSLKKEDRTLSYDENRLRFEFIGVHPDDPGKIAYKYRLKGLPDPQWSPETEKQSVTFNHLPPGSYELQVKARNSDGIWSPKPLRYSFSIEPPFWQTTWFYSGSGVLGLFLVFLILQIRTRSLVRHRKRLEEEVSERTRELEREKSRIEEINRDLEQKKAEAEQQKELVEAKNQEITDSLHYAKRIQRAVLKEENRVSEHLPPHFVYFKPRDIVSGDFYWALEKKGYLYLTVADCTGHGVPGAFMSMLGIAYLNEICAGEVAKSPSSILHELREKILEELTRNPGHEQLSDGMDISLMRVHLESGEVCWAGANNPLWRIRPKKKDDPEDLLLSKDGERVLIEHHPDRKPIGLSDDEDPFTEHRIHPEEGEVLYIFSDGFQDQFGGDRGKKYKSSNFKRFLLDLADTPVEEQRGAIKEEFYNWMGDQEQVDDVCVVGIAPGTEENKRK